MIRSSLATFVHGVAAVAVAAAVAAAFAGAAVGATYTALGDSYSSGVGTASYTLDSACKRSMYAYPYLYTQKHPGTSLTFVACSGAKTSDLLVTQIQAVTGATTLVSCGCTCTQITSSLSTPITATCCGTRSPIPIP